MEKKFKVGTTIESVEVYVHNYEEYFLQTINKMEIEDRVQKSITRLGLKIESGVTKHREKVEQIEKEYLREVGYKSKESYRQQVVKYSQSKGNNQINQLINDYVMLSPDSMDQLQKYVKEINKPLPSVAQAKRMISKTLKPLIQGLSTIIENLITEQEKVSKGDFADTNLAALKKRKRELAKAASKISSQKTAQQIANAKNLTELRGIIGSLRYEHLGIVFEPLASLFLQNFHNEAIKDFENMVDGAGRNVTMTLTGDLEKIVGVSDSILITENMKIGVDIKSSPRLYVKSTRKTGYAYELTSQILLGEGGLNDFFGDIGGGDPKLLKQIAYIIVNMNIFNNIAALKETAKTSHTYNAMRALVVAGALSDFLATYIKKFDTIYRKQILIMAGNQIYFLTDLIDMLVQMVKDTRTFMMKKDGVTKKKQVVGQFGTIANVSTANVPTANVGEHASLLHKKRKVMKNNKVRYEVLFNKLGKKDMKKLVTPALRQSMKVTLNLPLSKRFKG